MKSLSMVDTADFLCQFVFKDKHNTVTWNLQDLFTICLVIRTYSTRGFPLKRSYARIWGIRTNKNSKQTNRSLSKYTNTQTHHAHIQNDLRSFIVQTPTRKSFTIEHISVICCGHRLYGVSVNMVVKGKLCE